MYCCLCNRNILRRKTSAWPYVWWEYVELKMKADVNWKVYVPTAWRTRSNASYWTPFDWYVSVWNSEPVHISWNSARQWYREVMSWLTPWEFYYIKITPYHIDEDTWLPDYWWLRWFWMWWDSAWWSPLTYKNPIADYLYEVVYDWSFMWYAVSETSLWDWFKCAQFAWCTNLTKPVPEVDISQVTSIWFYYREAQYAWCTSLQYSATESISDLLTTIWVWFREHQYYWCTSLSTASDEHDAANMTNPWHSYREWQYRYCTSLRVTWPENPPQTLHWWNEYKYNQYDWCTWITTISRVQYLSWQWNTSYRWDQFKDCWSQSSPITAYFYWTWVIEWSTNSLWLIDANVYRIYVPSNLVNAYRNSPNWTNITSTKFVWM